MKKPKLKNWAAPTLRDIERKIRKAQRAKENIRNRSDIPENNKTQLIDRINKETNNLNLYLEMLKTPIEK